MNGMTVRWMHPEKFDGQMIAVMVGAWHHPPTQPTKFALSLSFATAEKAITGQWVKHGGLINQFVQWRREGVVIGIVGQTGAGLVTPWALHPVSESRRGEAEALLALDHVKALIDAGPPA